MATNQYSHLLSPGRIGPMEMRNRIVLMAMGVNFGEDDGVSGDRIVAFHESHARGGAALIISGACGVMYPIGQVQPWQIGISDDRFIPGMARLAEGAHRHGAKFAVQLHQGGLVAGDDVRAGRPQWCPSIPDPVQGDFADGFLPSELQAFAGGGVPTYKVLTKDDIRTLIEHYAAAARRARQAGADAVELHAGHGYILSEFLSPKTNKRTDEYGGSVENRSRLMLEVLREVLREAGNQMAVIVKLDSREVGKEGGITLEHAKVTAKLIEEAGATRSPSPPTTTPASASCTRPRTSRTSRIRTCRGRRDQGSGEDPDHHFGACRTGARGRRDSAGRLDYLGMGRKLLADPDCRASSARGGRQVRPCIYCYTCVSAIYTLRVHALCGESGSGVRVSACKPAEAGAPQAGRRCRRWPRRHGGSAPTGARRARSGAVRAGDRLGGTLRFASIAYQPNERLLDWLEVQLGASAVEVRLNTAATAELLKQWKADDVVVATGARRSMPPIPGADLAHVYSGDDMRRLVLGESSQELERKTSLFTRLATKAGAATGLTGNLEFIRKATHAWMPLGKSVAIIGGELVGLELAEFLSERGRTVHIVDESPRFGAGLMLVRRMRILAELREHGVGLHAEAKDIRIEKGRVGFTDKDGAARSVDAEHVIVAKGASGDSRQADAFRTAGLRVHEVGDGTGVGYIEGAIRGAHARGRCNQCGPGRRCGFLNAGSGCLGKRRHPQFGPKPRWCAYNSRRRISARVCAR
jgi:2,4-dienoyl-CoA reductase-like NADH-dependent reductase (Old Yellow Enzyme family)